MGSSIRGSRIGSGPTGESERGEVAPRQRVPYFCANGHRSSPAFAHDAELPDTWDCPRCGLPTGRDEHAPPSTARVAPYKTHLAYVRERRNEADSEAILAEALAKLREQ